MVAPSIILAWKNPMDRGAWQATVHGVAESPAGLRSMYTHGRCHEGFSFSSSLPAFGVITSFNFSCSDRCSFNLHFPIG